MVVTENECVDCGLPCIGRACKYYSVTRYYCDECDSEETLYEFNGKELCIDCIAKHLPIVEGSNY
jgi:hypothetical protein